MNKYVSFMDKKCKVSQYSFNEFQLEIEKIKRKNI